MSRNVAQAWVETLADAGVTHMFGLIGTTILDLVDAVAVEPRMRYVGVRHEQAASSMAAGFTRVTGRIAVCVAHGGAGAANLVLGVASAFKNSIPMIVITGSDRVSKLGRDAFNEIDVQRLFAPITKSTERIERPDDAVLKVRRALVTALSGRPGPVHIDLPQDVAGLAVTSVCEAAGPTFTSSTPGSTLPWTSTPLATDDVHRIADALLGSKRPLLYLGAGVAMGRAEQSARALVAKTGCAVVVTDDARGCIPDEHAAFVGTVGRQRSSTARRAVAEAEVVVAIGTRFSDHATDAWRWIPQRAQIVHIDVDPATLGAQYSPWLGVQADAATAMRQLAEAITGESPMGIEQELWRNDLRRAFAEERSQRLTHLDDGGPSATSVVAELNRVAACRDVIWTVDAGIFNNPTDKLRIHRPRSFLRSGSLGAMGLALPQAIAAGIADATSIPIALVGDGGFAMVVQEFETAIREEVNVKVVVFNNGGFGSQVVQQQQRYGGRLVGVEHGNADHVLLVQAYGGWGTRVDRSETLGAALEEALAQPGVALVDVIIPLNDGPKEWIQP